MAKEFEKTHTRRIIALALCFVVVFALGVVRVFQYQVVNGEAYLAQAQRSTETKVTVTAARGEIVDRNGVPLTQNQAAFNLELDYTLMKKTGGSKSALDNDAANETINKLIRSLEKLGEDWIDELPITLTEPYTFKPGATETEIKRLRSNCDVNDYATAQDCLYWIFKNYGIKKYKVDGKCTHCGQEFDQCEYQGYDEAMSRKIAGVRYQMLVKEFAYTDGHTRYTFAEGIAPESVAWIREQLKDFPGATVTEKPIRTYVSGNVGASMIGSIGAIPAKSLDSYLAKGYPRNATVGTAGIELAMEDILRGKDGTMNIVQNSQGEVINSYEVESPVAGKTVQLTLDYYYQKELQKILADYVETYNRSIENKPDVRKSQSASLVVLDVKTGGVLAAISYPFYDINEDYGTLLNAEGNPMFNRALQGTYQPGSTFKPIVAAGGLMEGIITPQSQIECTWIYRFFSDYQPKCLMDGHRVGSLQTVTTALQHSCNIFFYDVGRQLTIEKMNGYANKFGLAVNTGLEIPSAVGRLNTRADENWQAGNVLQAAIGQLNIGVTPLQMACEALTFANQGTRYSTHLVQNIRSFDGTEILETKQPVVAAQMDLGEAGFQAIKEGMVLVGEAQKSPYQLNDLGYRVAMKTGTPQSTSATRFNSAAVGFAPADAPEIAFAIMLEDTDNSTYTAKKLVRSILTTWEKAKAHPGVDLSTIPDASAEPEGASSGTEGTVSSGAASGNPALSQAVSEPAVDPAYSEGGAASAAESGGAGTAASENPPLADGRVSSENVPEGGP